VDITIEETSTGECQYRKKRFLLRKNTLRQNFFLCMYEDNKNIGKERIVVLITGEDFESNGPTLQINVFLVLRYRAVKKLLLQMH